MTNNADGYIELTEFERIPIYYSYGYFKDYYFSKCDELKISVASRPYHICAQSAIATFFDEFIEEYGMSRVALMVLAAIYEIEHNDLDHEIANAVKWHIEDFEKGDYDDLFEEEDGLDLLKADIAIVKDYLAKHPEALEEK